MKHLIALTLIIMSVSQAYASDSEIFDIKLTVTELSEAEVAQAAHEAELDAAAEMKERAQGGVIKQVSEMVGIGEYVYKIVDSNRPSISTSFSPIRILPTENGRVVDYQKITGLRGRGARFSYKGVNIFGAEVARLDYTILFWRGTYRKGRYLQSVVINTHSSTGWGNRLEASAQLENIANIGTRTNPVARATLKITSKISNLLRSEENQDTILVDAAGRIRAL